MTGSHEDTMTAVGASGCIPDITAITVEAVSARPTASKPDRAPCLSQVRATSALLITTKGGNTSDNNNTLDASSAA